jgi:hypothetical protein
MAQAKSGGTASAFENRRFGGERLQRALFGPRAMSDLSPECAQRGRPTTPRDLWVHALVIAGSLWIMASLNDNMMRPTGGRICLWCRAKAFGEAESGLALRIANRLIFYGNSGYRKCNLK